MANSGAPDETLGNLQNIIDGLRAQVREIATFDGSQNTRAIEKLKLLIDDLPNQVFAVLAVAVNTGNVTATGFGHFGGAVTAASVATTGDVSAGGTGTFPVGLSSAGAYNNLLTSGYRVAYVSAAAYGYVPSSRQFKQDIVTADLSEDIWLALRLVTFRYIAAVSEFGDDAAIEIGLIAEEVHELGLHWLVDYDEEGKPFGVKYDKLALLLVPALQSIDARLRAAGI